MNILLKKIHMENFKIFQSQTIDFSELTKIFAQNYSGKSSIADAFTWVLFGKSSTGNSEGKQFRPRRYDENGVDIDRVLVVVELLLNVDGRDILIRKTQKQNWVRKRGSEVETYEGDSNIYHWNEVEVKETEHKKRVAEIIDEELFKMITNPHAFVGKKQDEQRKFLVEKVAMITDEEVFDTNEKFAELQAMIGNNTLEEIKAINKKALQGYKEQQESIPIRIDEVSKSIVELDFSAKELQLNSLKEQLAEVELKISDTSKSYEEVGKLKTEIAEIKTKISSIEWEEKNKLDTSKKEITNKLDNVNYSISNMVNKQKKYDQDILLSESSIEANEKLLSRLKEDYTTEKNRAMDENSCTCPVCQQEFPEDKKVKMQEDFQSNKDAKLLDINRNGASVNTIIKNEKSRLEELNKQLVEVKSEIERLTPLKETLINELNSKPTEVNLSANKEYQDFKATLSALEFSLSDTLENLKDTDTLKANLNAQKQEIQSQIEIVQGVIASKKTIDDAKDRVVELKEELVQATIQAAKCERILLLLEDFEKAKMDLLSERINSKFKVVKWKLFHTQKNGGVENVCVCMINGSQYGENTTSTTERLMAGLDIVSTLQDIHNTNAPIWIDNAESYNDFNIPKMDCQMVLIKVAEPIYEYMTDANGEKIMGADGKPIIAKVIYDGSLVVEHN